MSKTKLFDAVVIGGGLVGTACTVALAQQGFKLALIESAQQMGMPADNGWDSRIYAISPGNTAWLEGLGVWSALDQSRITSIVKMLVYGDDGESRLEFNAYEANAACLGHIVENRLLQHGLWAALSQSSVEVQTGVQCKSIDWQHDLALIQLDDGQSISSKLVIAADGANSRVRRQTDIALQGHDYGQMGVVANFETTLSHQCIARQWFREDGVLAWLPLAGNRISMVWSTHRVHAEALLNLSPQALSDSVAEAGQQVLGKLRLITPAAAFPLSLQSVHTVLKPRLVLIGDAAHVIHPLAGQGVNLGFRDAEALAKILAQRSTYQDIGDAMLLRRYERCRKADMMAMQHTTDGLQKLFASPQPRVKKLRNWGLRLTDSQATLKKRLMAQAMI
jgi:2-polyprenylphenol 6-hydroxylase